MKKVVLLLMVWSISIFAKDLLEVERNNAGRENQYDQTEGYYQELYRERERLELEIFELQEKVKKLEKGKVDQQEVDKKINHRHWLKSEIEHRKFFLSGRGYDEETEIRTKLGYGEVKFTDKTKLYFDFRRIDYYKGSDKTGWGWDHQMNFYYDHNKINWAGKEWINRFGLGWEGDWNYNSENKLNWESHDFYLEWNLITFFNNGLTPWDSGSHILNFKPILSEFIVFGESSKFHKSKDDPGWNRWETGLRQQLGTIWLISNWNKYLKTIFNFRTYVDTIDDSMDIHWGGENYSTLYITQPADNKFYWTVEGKFEWYWGQGSPENTAKDKFVEFYMRPQLNYKWKLDEVRHFDFYTGYDLIEYHYVHNPWSEGSYHRREWVTGIRFNTTF